MSIGVTTLLSMTVFLMLVADSMPPNADSLPLIGKSRTSISLIRCLLSRGVLSLGHCHCQHCHGDVRCLTESIPLREAQRASGTELDRSPILLSHTKATHDEYRSTRILEETAEGRRRRPSGRKILIVAIRAMHSVFSVPIDSSEDQQTELSSERHTDSQSQFCSIGHEDPHHLAVTVRSFPFVRPTGPSRVLVGEITRALSHPRLDP